jgi:hypothetical protein
MCYHMMLVYNSHQFWPKNGLIAWISTFLARKYCHGYQVIAVESMRKATPFHLAGGFRRLDLFRFLLGKEPFEVHQIKLTESKLLANSLRCAFVYQTPRLKISSASIL